MIRALALLALLAGFVKAPPAWYEDTAQANALAAKANKLLHFGGAPAVATAQVFVGNDGPGALYVIAVAGKVKENRDAAARVALDDFLGAPKRAQLSSPKVSISTSASRLDAAAKQIEATLQWQDDDAQTITHARLLIVADAENVVAVTAECVLSPLNAKATIEACDKALATLDTEIPLARRVGIALAPEGSEPPPSSTGSGSSAQPTMSDGSRTPMPPITLPSEPKRTVDRRPVYVGAGIVVLAGLFWWNRRRREAADAVKKERDE